MKTITLSAEDAEQIKAILMTHSEMVDHHAMPSLELIGSMRKQLQDGPDTEVQDMIDSLQDQVTDFEFDSENLKRLASLF